VACERLSSRTNLRECEDQSWFEVQAVPVLRFDSYNIFACPWGYAHPRLKTIGVGHGEAESGLWSCRQEPLHRVTGPLPRFTLGL
jgi:hypothetical protein